MLTRVIPTVLKRFSTASKLFISEVPTFTQIDALNQHFDEKRANFSAVYFRSSWNPECTEADRDIARLKKQYPQVEIVAVDSDQSEELKKYYDIKNEPQVVICFYGDQVTRHVGVNYDNLRKRLDRVVKLQEEVNFEGIPEWVPFGSCSNIYYDLKLREGQKWSRQ